MTDDSTQRQQTLPPTAPSIISPIITTRASQSKTQNKSVVLSNKTHSSSIKQPKIGEVKARDFENTKITKSTSKFRTVNKLKSVKLKAPSRLKTPSKLKTLPKLKIKSQKSLSKIKSKPTIKNSKKELPQRKLTTIQKTSTKKSSKTTKKVTTTKKVAAKTISKTNGNIKTAVMENSIIDITKIRQDDEADIDVIGGEVIGTPENETRSENLRENNDNKENIHQQNNIEGNIENNNEDNGLRHDVEIPERQSILDKSSLIVQNENTDVQYNRVQSNTVQSNTVRDKTPQNDTSQKNTIQQSSAILKTPSGSESDEISVFELVNFEGEIMSENTILGKILDTNIFSS